jgi:hypothetical protein
MKIKRENRLLLKFGYALIYIIPIISIFVFLFFFSVFVKDLAASVIFFITLFFMFGLYKRWVLYFDDKFACVFFILYGRCILEYKYINIITPGGGYGGGIVLVLEYKNNTKLNKAIFEVNSYSYMIEVLNFLHERVENGVIKNSDFEKMGIFFIDGKYQKRGNHSKKL